MGRQLLLGSACGHTDRPIYMIQVIIRPFIFFGLVFGEPPSRDGKSLLNTFPFNQNNRDHATHHEHNNQHVAETVRDSKQGLETNGPGVGFRTVSQADAGDDGRKCIEKVEMITETEYDEAVTCDHSYDKRCHTSYVTNYDSQQQEECKENYKKTCQILYEKIAFNETVSICRKPPVKDCNVQGPEICRTQYESECWTKQEKHEVVDDVVDCQTETETKCEDETSGYTTTTKCFKWPREVCSISQIAVDKFTPVTGCTKEPRELCAPAGCGFVPGPEECHEKVQTVVQDNPKEECSLEPQRTCKFVTKLVPKLEPKLECVDIPKEVCTRSRTNPRKVKKPVIKKWCYVPSEESGLA